MWAVSPDPAAKLGEYAEANGIAFPLLSDPDLEAIRAWGIVNPDRGSVPHPTAAVVDADGVIRYLRQDVDYRRRPPAEELLGALDGLGGGSAGSSDDPG